MALTGSTGAPRQCPPAKNCTGSEAGSGKMKLAPLFHVRRMYNRQHGSREHFEYSIR